MHRDSGLTRALVQWPPPPDWSRWTESRPPRVGDLAAPYTAARRYMTRRLDVRRVLWGLRYLR